jgi:mono/diheme cytochrome c family protein
MYRAGIFAATSFAVTLSAMVSFPGISTSKAADFDAKGLYMTHCKTCHGADGKPTDLGLGLEARDLTDPDWQAKVTDEQIINQITNGTPDKMFPFKGKLSDEEIKALVPVIRSFGKK